jgi:predicted transcriptional regulator
MMSNSDNVSHTHDDRTTTHEPPVDERASDASGRTLHLTVGGSDYEQLLATAGAVDRGEDPEPFLSRSFDSLDELQRALAPTNVALLRTIVRESPDSIRETARLAERDIKDVHRNLNELARLGLIEFEDDGHAKQPTVWYDRLQVDLDLADDRSAVERLGAALDTQ